MSSITEVNSLHLGPYKGSSTIIDGKEKYQIVAESPTLGAWRVDLFVTNTFKSTNMEQNGIQNRHNARQGVAAGFQIGAR